MHFYSIFYWTLLMFVSNVCKKSNTFCPRGLFVTTFNTKCKFLFFLWSHAQCKIYETYSIKLYYVHTFSIITTPHIHVHAHIRYNNSDYANFSFLSDHILNVKWMKPTVLNSIMFIHFLLLQFIRICAHKHTHTHTYKLFFYNNSDYANFILLLFTFICKFFLLCFVFGIVCSFVHSFSPKIKTILTNAKRSANIKWALKAFPLVMA